MAFKRSGVRLPLAPPFNSLIKNEYSRQFLALPSIYAFREAPGKHQEQPDRTDDQAEVLYRPTQLLALLIKANGYDGFIYPSAMGPGKNVVLFDPANVEVQPVSYTR